jgi:hypothetical protein
VAIGLVELLFLPTLKQIRWFKRSTLESIVRYDRKTIKIVRRWLKHCSIRS